MRVREATSQDIDALSRLLVQLYAHELPGMLRGDIAAQVELARGLLSAAPLGRRYVLERNGEVVGMGSLATDDEPRPETPARVLLRAPRVMGAVNGAWTILGAARGLLTAADPPGPAEGQIHSVVVDEARRGKRLGAVILRHLERDAVGLGKRRAALQVISSNTTARGVLPRRRLCGGRAPARPATESPCLPLGADGQGPAQLITRRSCVQVPPPATGRAWKAKAGRASS